MDDEIADAKPAPAQDLPTADAPAPITLRSSGDVTAPIVVDLGRRRRKQIKQLKRRKGPLVEEVDDVIAQVRAALAADLDGKTLVPIVMVYKQKKKRARSAPTALFSSS
jgi:hypothetical protein